MKTAQEFIDAVSSFAGKEWKVYEEMVNGLDLNPLKKLE